MDKNEEIYEEFESEEVEMMDTEKEKELLINTINDAQERLAELEGVEELSDDEESDTTGGVSFGKTYYRSVSGNAYCNFYRVMFTSCPGTITNYWPISSGLTFKRLGTTLMVYRDNIAGKKQFKILSVKGQDKYYTTFTVNFH